MNCFFCHRVKQSWYWTSLFLCSSSGRSGGRSGGDGWAVAESNKRNSERVTTFFFSGGPPTGSSSNLSSTMPPAVLSLRWLLNREALQRSRQSRRWTRKWRKEKWTWLEEENWKERNCEREIKRGRDRQSIEKLNSMLGTIEKKIRSDMWWPEYKWFLKN